MLVSWEILFKQDLFAIGAMLVLIRVLTLFHQMFVHALNLNHLLTLPACSQHGTLLPVVNVYRFLVEILVKCSTEIAHFIVILKFFFFISILN